MKKLVFALLMAICVSSGAHASAPNRTSQVEWLDYVLNVVLFTDSAEHIVDGLGQPEGCHVVLRLEGANKAIAPSDIAEYCTMFALRDAQGALYPIENYIMPDVLFDIETGAFTVEEKQSGFDLYFDIPADITLGALSLRVFSMNGEFSELSLSNTPQEVEELIYVPGF